MRRALLAALLALAGTAVALPAQIPGLPRPGGQRPVQPPAPGTPPDTTRPARAQRAPAPADTLLDRLMQLEGYTPVEYSGDSAEYRRPERTLWLRGNPSVRREEVTLVSDDSIVYQEQAELVAAYGKPEVTGQGDPVLGDVLFYHLGSGRASVRGARTRFSDQATWLVNGDADVEDQGRRIYASNSTFTTDDREVPAYHFRADRIMVLRDRVLIGRPAYLYFRNVPVMALPFIVQDLAKGRRSGVLIPEFEINDIIRNKGGRQQRGTGREITNIGYYFALNDYVGLSLSGGWRSGSYSSMGGNLDFNWRRRFLSGNAAFTRYSPSEGGSQFSLRGGVQWQPTERMSLAGSADYTTSSRFERNREVNPFRQTEDLGSSLSLTRRMDWGSLTSGLQVRQSLANGDESVIPSVTLSLNSWTPFPAGSAASRSLINEITINPGGLSFTGNRLTPGEDSRRQRTETYSGAFGPSISIGNFSVGTTTQYQLERLGVREALGLGADTTGIPPGEQGALGGRMRETFAVSAQTGYQIPLFATTRISPSISFGRQYVRADTVVVADTLGGPELADSLRAIYGSFVAGPARVNFGASLSTDLYGFFPGFGEYAAIRHHISPSFDYRYSPAVSVDSTEDRVRAALFGTSYAKTVSEISIGFDQTFEAKLREPRPVAGDTMADSASAAGNRAEPAQPRKITLLALDTDAIQYTFVGNDSLPAFRNEVLNNNISSDLFGGLRFNTTHDLFDDEIQNGRVARGGFSPFLTSVQTSLSFGQNSALFRWLGFSRATESERGPERGRTPDGEGTQPLVSGNATALSNNQAVGRGPWNVSLNYSLARRRPSVADALGESDRGNQQVSGSLTFTPTPNWGVTWNTGYSLTTGQFDTHVLNVKRDLYRWQANFDFVRAPNGNTRFGFRVHLIDLPDLKADYDETYTRSDRLQSTTRPGTISPSRENPRQVPR